MNESIMSYQTQAANLGEMTIQSKFTPFITWQNFIYLNVVTRHDCSLSSLLASNSELPIVAIINSSDDDFRSLLASSCLPSGEQFINFPL